MVASGGRGSCESSDAMYDTAGTRSMHAFRLVDAACDIIAGPAKS